MTQQPTVYPGENHGDRSDPKTTVGLVYRLVSDRSCTLGALTLLCPLVTVIGLVALLLADSPTCAITSALIQLSAALEQSVSWHGSSFGAGAG